MEGLHAFPLKIFPIEPGELPPGASPQRDVLCHCALGSMVQILSACGRDVDRELPWIKPWFVRYQMADGGLNCDDTAYRQRDECHRECHFSSPADSRCRVSRHAIRQPARGARTVTDVAGLPCSPGAAPVSAPC